MPVRSADDSDWDDLLAEQLRSHKRLFYRIAFGIVHDHGHAEDLCQQAIVKACEFRAQLQDGPALRAWLARTISNLSLAHRRRRSTEKRVLTNHVQDLTEMGDTVAGLARIEGVEGALKKLPEEVRTVVILRLMQGVSGNEAKEFLDTSAADVSRKLKLGMGLLRDILSDWKES